MELNLSEQLAALRVSLSQSAIPGETPAVSPAQANPPREIVAVTDPTHTGLLILLFTGFFSMLAQSLRDEHKRVND